MKFKAILFDLDGTLLDTLADLANSMNAALTSLSFPTHPIEAYRHFVGDGVDMLARRTLPKDHLDEETVSKCLAEMKNQYSKRWADDTVPYPGIGELLTSLDELGITKIIFSNKPDDFTQLTVTKLLSPWTFKIVRGIKPGTPKKPNPTAALQIAAELNLTPAQILYLGDTNTDMQTATNAGMYPVGALWGFREAKELKANGAKALVEKPQDVLDFLKG